MSVWFTDTATASGRCIPHTVSMLDEWVLGDAK